MEFVLDECPQDAKQGTNLLRLKKSRPNAMEEERIIRHPEKPSFWGRSCDFS
jgi:hypothetical protein